MTKKMTLPVPPRLSMDDYIRFIAENWKNGDAVHMQRQTDLEERIEKPFCIPSDEPMRDSC